MQKITRIFPLLFGVWLLLLNVASAEVRIVIDEGVEGARPIAIVPFKWNAPNMSLENIDRIISDDLRNSGKFSPLLPSKMPQQPTSLSEINPQAWVAQGIDAIVIGQITPVNGNMSIHYQLVDVIGATGKAGAILAENQFIVTPKWWRYGAHTISDEVFEKLTAIRGAFRTRIAYVSQKNAGNQPYELRIADYDGFNQFTVVRSNQPIMSPAWSANGKQLAYVMFENRKSQLFMQDLASGQRQVIANYAGHNGAPAFSPDGSRLAFSSNREGVLNIYVMDLESRQVVQLTQGVGNNTEPTWSSDSQTIYFTSDRGGSPQIYQMEADGSNVMTVSSGIRAFSPQLSADSRELFMIVGDHLVKKDLETGRIEALSSTFLDESPSLSPNGIMVIYSSTQGFGKVLQLVSADGRFKARLPSTDGQVKFPAWSPYLTQK